MPNITNKEWIDNNNLKIDDLITQASELPDYQDIEPIYRKTGLRLSNPYNLGSVTIYNVDRYKNYFFLDLLRNNSQRYRELYKVDENNNLVQLMKKYIANSSGYEYLSTLVGIDEENTTVHFIDRLSYGTPYIRYFNWTNSTTDEYSAGTLSGNNYPLQYLNFVDNGILYYGNKTRVKKVADLVNHTVSTTTYGTDSTSAVIRYTSDFYVYNNTGIGYIVNATTGAKSSSTFNTAYLGFINPSGTKIMIENNLYILNNDLTVRSLIKEDVFTIQQLGGAVSKRLVQYDNDIYVSNKGEFFKFNDTDNTFTLMYENSNDFVYANGYNSASCPVYYYANSQNISFVLADDDYTSIIGYYIKGNKVYINTREGVTSKYILEGMDAYDFNGVQISGTMPNNGELNYTPSTSQQTIPAGYTSGGTIEAVSMTEQDIQEAEDIISDLFGNSNYTYDTPIYDLCKTDTIVNDIGSTKFNIVDISAENTIKDRDLVESIASALENSEKSSLGIYIAVYDTVNKTANVSVNGCVQPYIYAYRDNDQIKLDIMLKNNAENENYILYVDGLTNTFSGVSENGWYHRYDYDDFDGSYLNVQYIGDLPQSVYNNVLSHQYAYNIVDYSHNSDNLKLAAKILDSIIHLKIEEVN